MSGYKQLKTAEPLPEEGCSKLPIEPLLLREMTILANDWKGGLFCIISTYYKCRSFVRALGVARLLAVYATCFQPPPALRPRTGPMCNPSHTGACTVYFNSPAKPAGFSGTVPMVRPCRTGRATGTCHAGGSHHTQKPQSGCNGLSQFKRTQANPLYLP